MSDVSETQIIAYFRFFPDWPASPEGHDINSPGCKPGIRNNVIKALKACLSGRQGRNNLVFKVDANSCLF
jgi:hypothetical protein